MEECPAACWEYMKPLLQENGCVALYYDTIFAMTFNSGLSVCVFQRVSHSCLYYHTNVVQT